MFDSFGVSRFFLCNNFYLFRILLKICYLSENILEFFGVGLLGGRKFYQYFVKIKDLAFTRIYTIVSFSLYKCIYRENIIPWHRTYIYYNMFCLLEVGLDWQTWNVIPQIWNLFRFINYRTNLFILLCKIWYIIYCLTSAIM